MRSPSIIGLECSGLDASNGDDRRAHWQTRLAASGKVAMRRTYVIGDIHGCYREFKQLLDLCSDDAEGKPAQLILLGDYVDRGPNSLASCSLSGIAWQASTRSSNPS